MPKNTCATSYLSKKVIENTQTENFTKYIQKKIDTAINHEEGYREGFIHTLSETEELIITSPQIQAEIQGPCHTQIMRLLNQSIDTKLQQKDNYLKTANCISRALLMQYINHIIISHATQLSNLYLDKRDGYISKVKINNKTTKASRRIGTENSQAQALKMVLEEREKLLEKKAELKANKERRSPNKTICTSLVKKGILTTNENGEFRIKGMTITLSPYEGSSKLLRIRNEEYNIHTTRSLDEHSFNTAYDQLITMLHEHAQLPPKERKELAKFRNYFLYLSKPKKSTSTQKNPVAIAAE